MLGTAASDRRRTRCCSRWTCRASRSTTPRAQRRDYEELHPVAREAIAIKAVAAEDADSASYSPSRFTTAAVGSPSRFLLGSTAQKREILDAEAHRVSEAARAELHMRNQAPLPTDLSDVANVVGWVERHMTRGGSPPAHRIRRVEDADPAAAEDAAEAEAVAADRRRGRHRRRRVVGNALGLQARMLVEAEHAVGQRREDREARAGARGGGGRLGRPGAGRGRTLEAEARLRAQFADGADVRLRRWRRSA